MKVLRLDDGCESLLEIEPQSDDSAGQLLLSVEENGTWNTIYIDSQEAMEIINYLKEHFNL